MKTTTSTMIRRTTSLALAAIFITGCASSSHRSSAPPAPTAESFWTTAVRSAQNDVSNLTSAGQQADKECAGYTRDLSDREACYKRILQTGFISKAIYPEYAREFVDASMHAMMLSWTGQISPEQLRYTNTRLLTEYAMKRDQAFNTRYAGLQAQESAGSARWAEIGAAAATSIGTAAVLSQPQFTDPPVIMRQPYWMYQGSTYQNPLRDEYHMHPGTKW